MSRSNQSVAIVTGASTGIGRASAEALVRAGYTVFGTSRKAISNGPKDVTMLVADVTDDASVKKMVDDVLAKEGRIDLLVNNAGIGLSGAAEENSIGEVRALFETNYFGVVRVTNAVLPVMRAQGRGRILNLSSAAGIIPMPYSAHYAATKHALEGYSESLDHETREFGVRISLIEPGPTRSSFEGSTISAETPIAAYDKSRAKQQLAFDSSMAEADTVDIVSDAIIRAATDKKLLMRYPAGKVANQVSFIRRFMPRSLFDKQLHKLFGLG